MYLGFLAIYHLAFSLVYWKWLHVGSDAENYIKWAAEGMKPGWMGTPFVVNVIEIFPAMIIAQHELIIYILFSLIGLAGFLVLEAALTRTDRQSRPQVGHVFILRALLLLPSLHLWSAAVGKDAFAMLAVGLFIFGLVHSERYAAVTLLGIVVMGLVRPHIGYLMLLSWIVFAVYAHKWMMAALATIALLIATPVVLDYTGLPGITELISYISERQTKNLEGTTSAAISDKGLIANVVRYFIMPLSEAGIFGLVAGLNNIVIWLFLVGIFVPKLFSWNRLTSPAAIALLLFAGAATVLLALTTANYGIAMRQKAMILPILFAFCAIPTSARPTRMPQ